MHCPVNPLTYCCGDTATAKYTKKKQDCDLPDFEELARVRHTTPQPHFMPGYTGHTPGNIDALGQTYSHYNYNLLRDHPVGGSRLSRIPEDFAVRIEANETQRRGENPHETLQPYFVPGYTGFIPGSGTKRSEGIGQIYGKMTHILMAKHILEAGRLLRPIYKYPKEYVDHEEDVKFYCYEHELTRDDLRRRKDQVPGYAGHMPRALFRHGKSKTKIAEDSIAEFQKIIRK